MKNARQDTACKGGKGTAVPCLAFSYTGSWGISHIRFTEFYRM